MRKIRKTVAAFAATGLVAFGVLTATGGAAYAGTNIPLASCSTSGTSIVAANVGASCTAGTGNVNNPTSMTVTVDPSFFTVLLGNTIINVLLGGNLSATVTYQLTCVVDGSPVTSTTDTGFTVTSESNNTHTINLQNAVGSPAPNSCTLANLKVASAVSLGILAEAVNLLHLGFNFGVSATADNGTPGAIFRTDAANSHGAIPAICADDTGNGNHGTAVQAYTCESDLADQWLQVSTNQFVHNGDCLDDVGGTAKLSLCTANPGNSNTQVWNSVTEPGGYVELVNTATGQCLTSTSPTNGSLLTLHTCTGAKGQRWKVPGVTAA